ncbi:hypothetical protein HMPREF9997_00444 [Corynebacterium durum F0235]|uniref:Uncharacterized protein n=1 Tax=Corynebacterium durum F0235 TaxID=1035195 RepID=L1MKJ8_9CORY|nr:hypothetical protein HMPREF9997_00444 [Corynebacterium durum F0235]
MSYLFKDHNTYPFQNFQFTCKSIYLPMKNNFDDKNLSASLG